MNKRSELSPFFRKYHWVVPLAGVLFLIISPVLIPVLVCIENWSDFKDGYREIIAAIKYKPWANKEK